MFYLYVLALYDNKFYVGITKDFQTRLYQHDGSLPGGSIFVRKHRIQNIERLIGIETTDRRRAEWHEDLVTMEYAEKYGIDNVRGGRFISRKLPHKKYIKLSNRILQNNVNTI